MAPPSSFFLSCLEFSFSCSRIELRHARPLLCFGIPGSPMLLTFSFPPSLNGDHRPLTPSIVALPPSSAICSPHCPVPHVPSLQPPPFQFCTCVPFGQVLPVMEPLFRPQSFFAAGATLGFSDCIRSTSSSLFQGPPKTSQAFHLGNHQMFPLLGSVIALVRHNSCLAVDSCFSLDNGFGAPLWLFRAVWQPFSGDYRSGLLSLPTSFFVFPRAFQAIMQMRVFFGLITLLFPRTSRDNSSFLVPASRLL